LRANNILVLRFAVLVLVAGGALLMGSWVACGTFLFLVVYAWYLGFGNPK
jgi:hypothetical protein